MLAVILVIVVGTIRLIGSNANKCFLETLPVRSVRFYGSGAGKLVVNAQRASFMSRSFHGA